MRAGTRKPSAKYFTEKKFLEFHGINIVTRPGICSMSHPEIYGSNLWNSLYHLPHCVSISLQNGFLLFTGEWMEPRGQVISHHCIDTPRHIPLNADHVLRTACFWDIWRAILIMASPLRCSGAWRGSLTHKAAVCILVWGWGGRDPLLLIPVR